MAKKRDSNEAALDTLQKILIVQLAQAGVRGEDIRRIAGVQMQKVADIQKLIKKRKKGSE